MTGPGAWTDLQLLADRPFVPALGLASAVLLALCLVLLIFRFADQLLQIGHQPFADAHLIDCSSVPSSNLCRQRMAVNRVLPITATFAPPQVTQ